MKKIVSILLMLSMCVSITACGNSQAESKTELPIEPQNEIQTETQQDSQSETQTNTKPENQIQEATDTDTETDTNTGADSDVAESSNTLVVYFSATGNTKAIAEHIANGLSADIYEIIPELPYTDDDLDYNDNNSRSTLEMNDASVRPGISGSVENMAQYDIIYIGWPIWWGDAPRILSTFVESYDFTDKTIIPFCTSASSRMGSSATNLAETAGTGNWLSGKRFNGSESQDEIMEWVNGLGL